MNSLSKLVASTLILGTTTMGCSPAGQTAHPAQLGQAPTAKLAAKAAGRASAALAAKNYGAAIGFAEEAVAGAPQTATYRMTLGKAYQGAGRFASAAQAFTDVLTLTPDDSGAALNLALAQTALGKTSAALGTLNDYRERLSAADYGLAAVLAGDIDGGVSVLETAVRAGSADAKTRQNLGLAYAMAGKWTNARVMAVQDLPPAAADARIIEWMSFVRPATQSDQVASLLGVTAAPDDAGQPAQLALNAAAAPTATAFLEPEAKTVPVSTPAPTLAAEAAPAAPVFETTASVPAARTPAVATKPLAQKPVQQVVVASAPKSDARPAPVREAQVMPAPVRSGNYVVQLGAFANAASVEAAWNRSRARYNLGSYQPVSGAARHNGASLVRLSVGGFATRAQATQVCTRIQKAGGQCFVRGTAMDAPAQWVSAGATKFARR